MASEKDPLVSERSGTVREVGNHAIWSLSSCKPGLFQSPFKQKSRKVNQYPAKYTTYILYLLQVSVLISFEMTAWIHIGSLMVSYRIW